MFSQGTNRQAKAEFVTIEELVPKGHLLRKIDAVIDVSFINELCCPYYCADNGRPAIELEILFKMLFVGYLFGIRSERRLVAEVTVPRRSSTGWRARSSRARCSRARR
jgi:transposase